MPDTALANAVTGYATILSGVVTLLLTFLVAPQPWRWRLAYFAIFVTGLPTVWYHGFGETFWAKVADVGTNYLVSWAMIVAVLGDFCERRTRWIVAGLMFAIDTWGIYDMIITGAPSTQMVAVGSRGYSIRQLTLIANSLLATVLLYVNFSKIPTKARPLLHLQTAWFLFGAWLASAKNHRVDYTVLAYHATWHVIGAFGFIIIWAFNHVRFETKPAGLNEPAGVELELKA
jgi:hypothetical protein